MADEPTTRQLDEDETVVTASGPVQALKGQWVTSTPGVGNVVSEEEPEGHKAEGKAPDEKASGFGATPSSEKGKK